MRKIIGAINMTLDGIFDHNAGLPDEHIHRHYTRLLNEGDTVLYGRIAYQLMEFWRSIRENPSEDDSMNEFARSIDRIPKIVFSRTLKDVDWETASLATQGLEETALQLKQQTGKVIYAGSRSIITQLLEMKLLDELQLCVYPVVEGNGMKLFDSIQEKLLLKLTGTRTFPSGAVVLHYIPM